MSFEQGRESLARVESGPVPNSATSNVDNELPLPPNPEPVAPSSPLDAEARERMNNVMQSDIGITTLLNRLKQSISSARDFAAFLKERSSIEEKHAQSLKRLSRGTHDVIRRPESKGGSFAANFEAMTTLHDRMADNGMQYSTNLYQMHDELQELTSKSERDRKHWKQTGLEAEKRVQDAENAMNKAKGKYNTLAESYDRARTGERQSGKFGIKGTKSAEKQEEDLHRRLETADGDYASRVQAAQASRQDLVTTHRPQAVRALQETIRECDAGLSLQLSKYAALSEKMLLGNGLCISPLRSQAAGAFKSLREIAQSVDDQKDFQDYLLSFSAKAGSRPPDIKYEKHPALAPQQQRPTPPPAQSFETQQPQYGGTERTNTFDSVQSGHRPNHSGQISGVLPYQPPGGGPLSPSQPHQYQSPTTASPFTSQAPQLPQIGSFGSGPASPADRPYSREGPTPAQRAPQTSFNAPLPPTKSSTLDSFTSPTHSTTFDNHRAPQHSSTLDSYQAPQHSLTQLEGQPPSFSNSVGQFTPSGSHPPFHSDAGGRSISPIATGSASRGQSLGQPSDFPADARPPQSSNFRSDGPVPALATGPTGPAHHQNQFQPGQQAGGYRGASGPVGAAALPSNQRRTDVQKQNLAPLRPVFGVSLDELFRRDGTAVPSVVYQCVQAIDLHGLDTEGIYRTSGSAPHIMELKAQFDHDLSQVDLRNAGVFHHDVASVTTLLKHFFRDLPDSVLTSANYNQFIAAAKIDDDHIRRDSLHAIINALPDPNYATLRVMTLHLHRVAQHSEKNKMTRSNLAICLGPTLMGQNGNTVNGGANAAADIKDAGWQARVIETILNNAMQIFDDDE